MNGNSSTTWQRDVKGVNKVGLMLVALFVGVLLSVGISVAPGVASVDEAWATFAPVQPSNGLGTLTTELSENSVEWQLEGGVLTLRPKNNASTGVLKYDAESTSGAVYYPSWYDNRRDRRFIVAPRGIVRTRIIRVVLQHPSVRISITSLRLDGQNAVVIDIPSDRRAVIGVVRLSHSSMRLTDAYTNRQNHRHDDGS